MKAAEAARVPGGHALTVDRDVFSAEITSSLASMPHVEIRREEVTRIPPMASSSSRRGPLTSDALAEDIARHHRIGAACTSTTRSARSSMRKRSTTTIAFRASRYGKSLDGTDDYVNCPFDKEQYERFLDAVLSADMYESHFDENDPVLRGVPADRGDSRGADARRCASGP